MANAPSASPGRNDLLHNRTFIEKPCPKLGCPPLLAIGARHSCGAVAEVPGDVFVGESKLKQPDGGGVAHRMGTAIGHAGRSEEDRNLCAARREAWAGVRKTPDIQSVVC